MVTLCVSSSRRQDEVSGCISLGFRGFLRVDDWDLAEWIGHLDQRVGSGFFGQVHRVGYHLLFLGTMVGVTVASRPA